MSVEFTPSQKEKLKSKANSPLLWDLILIPSILLSVADILFFYHILIFTFFHESISVIITHISKRKHTLVSLVGGQVVLFNVSSYLGLDLIDRVPEELWTEVRDVVQEAVIKTIPKKKQRKRAKWLSEEALQIAEKRREVKGKGEKKRYTHLNAEFQRTARRDKKAFLSDQCKEIKENKRMGKTRDLFKKIEDIKGTFHARMDTIRDRNGKDLKEAEEIKKRWQEHAEELYKKI